MSDVPRGLAAALGERYAFEREVGAGGMATVYLARDLRHGRPVAIKVLRRDLGVPLATERFLREIETAARLQHPHILAVYDSGAVPGESGAPVPYFVMPYVEGESLRDRLRREGRIPSADALRITGEIAGALAYAHEHGVVHRDVKPENVMLSGGHALMADFGIARALESGAGTGGGGRLTEVGFRVGTPAYMSPEQAVSGDAIDARSDQYGLACVLYEMLTGDPAFAGATPQAVVTASIAGPRPDLRRARPDLPADLGRVVARGLAADPAARYPGVVAFADAAQAAAGVPIGTGPRRAAWVIFGGLTLVTAAAAFLLGRRASGSVVARGAETMAVVPFTAAGPGLDLMGEGMVDLLSTNLDGVGGIRTVDPRTVVARWHRVVGEGPAAAGRAGLDAALTVARDVGAGSVLLGSVVAAGGTVRMTAELHSIRGDELARARVDGPADSVLPLVDRLSVAVLRDIWRSREPVPSLQVSSITSGSLDAIRAFLQGEQFYRRAAWDSAIAAYGRATELDSTFALAYFRLATAYGWTGGLGAPYRAASAAGYRHADRLPARDRQLMRASRLFGAGLPAAVDSLRRYVALYPDDAQGWYLLGEALFHTSPVTAAPPDTIDAAFDTVVRLDSTLTPALVHPLQLAVSYRDRAAFERYERRFVAFASPDQAGMVRAAGEAVWGEGGLTDSLVPALHRPPRMTHHVLAAIMRGPATVSDTVAAAFATVVRGLPDGERRGEAQMTQLSALAGMGRLREAREMVGSVKGAPPELDLRLLGIMVLGGLLPPDSGAAEVGRWERGGDRSAIDQYYRGLLAIARGDLAEARTRLASVAERHAERPAGRDTARTPGDVQPNLRALAAAAGGWATLVQGDTAAGVRALETGLREVGTSGDLFLTSSLRLQLALAEAARPATRARGIRRLRYGFDSDPWYLPYTFFALGRALQSDGDREGAAQAYGQFARLWDEADPEFQPRLQQARQALQELAGEQP